MALDAQGNLYFADSDTHRIHKVTPQGGILTVAGTGVGGFSGDDGLAVNARVQGPRGIAIDDEGTLYIADTGNNRIRKVSPDGRITTIAGNGQPLARTPAVNLPRRSAWDRPAQWWSTARGIC